MRANKLGNLWVRGNTAALITVSALLLGACEQGRTPVNPPAKFPKINRFNADQTTVMAGDRVTLSYSVSDADTVEIAPNVQDAVPVLEGSVMTGALDRTTTFTLKAVSAAGETMRQLTV